MSQNEIKNEMNNDNVTQENIEKTSSIIKGINAVVIPNIDETETKANIKVTNFNKNEPQYENNQSNSEQLNDKNINNENYNEINNENNINNNKNDYNQYNNNNENNFNQFNQPNYEIDNSIPSPKDNETVNIISNNNTNNNIYNPNSNSNTNPNSVYNYNINESSNISNNDQNQNQNNPSETMHSPPQMFSPKNPSKKRNSYDKKSSKNSMRDLAFRFPIQESFSKVDIPFSFQQNLDDPNKDSHFHSYIRITGTPTLYMDISDDHKIDKLNMVSKIDSLKNMNKELEKKLKGIDDNIMKFKEDNSLFNKEIEKTKNEILTRNNEINKLKQTIQQLNQGNNKYDNDIKLKLQEKNNSYIKLKEMYDKIKSEFDTNKLDENKKKEYLLKIKEETNKIQKEYQNNFKYYSNKLMNNNIYPDEYIKQCLQKDLIDFNNYIGARIQMISPKVKELINYIQNAVDASIGKDYEVKLYGSHATGLCLPWSDIDVVLCKRNGEDIDTNLYMTLHDLYIYLKEKNNFKDIKHIGTTTVPLIKIKTKENIGIQSVDISLQDKSHYGIKCVSLVLSFKEEYEVFLPMILALKNILKQANLNDPYKVRNIFNIII